MCRKMWKLTEKMWKQVEETGRTNEETGSNLGFSTLKCNPYPGDIRR